MNNNKKQTKSDLAFEIAQEVLEARLTKGLTQKQLAQKMDTQQPAIARVENGFGLVSNTFLFDMAKVFKTRLVPPKFEFLEELRKVQLSLHSQSASAQPTNITLSEIGIQPNTANQTKTEVQTKMLDLQTA